MKSSMYASNLGVTDSSPCPGPSKLVFVAMEASDPVELLLRKQKILLF